MVSRNKQTNKQTNKQKHYKSPVQFSIFKHKLDKISISGFIPVNSGILHSVCLITGRSEKVSGIENSS